MAFNEVVDRLRIIDLRDKVEKADARRDDKNNDTKVLVVAMMIEKLLMAMLSSCAVARID